ncbi:MAG: DUF6165 family protein [Natronospirillum sp.]|uniref:DUF6165 family protein n=1 Tax=Natronospirillum sp. TaxID=2812955 RepID=UPI0025CFE135|nr:DUF6165 family protein [Natronospirillum sp.]MCH8553022.1 DUF6165 family protein [Natronospirillum sp.]
MLVETPVSLGEMVDKITILEIKTRHIKDAAKLKNVQHELDVLSERLNQLLDTDGLQTLQPLKGKLGEINQKLWNIEDDIRDCERQKDFGDTFVQLARAVYFTNDERAAVKKDINLAFGSELVEEKSYQNYN